MHRLLAICLISAAYLPPASAADPQPLTGTEALTMEGDIAAQLVAGVDKFLLRKIEESTELRAQYWKRDFSSAEAYGKSIEPNRRRLAHILGMRDERVPVDVEQGVSLSLNNELKNTRNSLVEALVRWQVTDDLWAEGLYLLPLDEDKIIANVIAIPDADQSPAQLAGLLPGLPREAQFARRLAESGCRVLIPTLVTRRYAPRNGRAKMTDREYVYRSAFELGHHIIGFELQAVVSAVDWYKLKHEDGNEVDESKLPICVAGYGEGGMLALYAAALDTRINATLVSGYFGERETLWQQPIDRNVFGLLREFGDAELASMVAPRGLVIEMSRGPELTLPSEGGAPAELKSPTAVGARQEHERALTLARDFGADLRLVERGSDLPGSAEALTALLSLASPKAKLAVEKEVDVLELVHIHKHNQNLFDESKQQARLVRQFDRHNQEVLRESAYVRKARFWDKLDTSSVEAYEKSIAPFREEFKNDVIGAFDDKPLPFNPRTRKAYDEEKWTGYEVVLDLWPDVICYGILCLPKDLKLDGSEKRPVVVCQHGLEGRPQDIVKGDHQAYHDFASKLCERGFITFAPQNLYIGQDKFRTLQRKANPLGKTLFSIIVPQHQQIVDWMQTLPYVDGERVAFYGLSYGGKSAMRIPPLVSDYCLSICSADFNEWVDKNASTRGPYSYVWTGEYEIFEWDLGSTFNYAEMAALIAPRPFMVERGHFDGVGTDENVAYEFAKVRNLYAARLKLPEDRCQIEWFVGPHTINGKGTFEFLHHHLKWPEK